MIHFNASDGTRIAYRDTGEGRPLLCLAGLTRNASDFDYLAPHLDGVRMICMDYRGRGASAWSQPPGSGRSSRSWAHPAAGSSGCCWAQSRQTGSLGWH